MRLAKPPRALSLVIEDWHNGAALHLTLLPLLFVWWWPRGWGQRLWQYCGYVTWGIIARWCDSQTRSRERDKGIALNRCLALVFSTHQAHCRTDGLPASPSIPTQSKAVPSAPCKFFWRAWAHLAVALERRSVPKTSWSVLADSQRATIRPPGSGGDVNTRRT